MAPETPDTQRDYTTILEQQIEEGLMALRRPISGQFLSGLSCGLDLGIGMFMLYAVHTAVTGYYDEPTMKFITSSVYTFGFIFVILGRLELFTEHTTLAVLPVLGDRSSMRELGILWGVVLFANLVGGALFSVVAVYAGPALGVIEPEAFIDIGDTFIELSPMATFTGAVFAGWLMGLLSWILTSAQDTISRMFTIFIVTFTIGFAHLPHCVAGNIEVLTGLLAGADYTVADFLVFEVLAILGNIVGGVVFVALFMYGHTVRTAGEQSVDISPTED
ncbi:formate/nitrite transporter family protein [Halomarina oriensis]|uniref:Formate/nitrite transporter family protein n=1 Tax=Halomarina oriensis TaxID=671145 RepID=A0A6B0GGL6_9EURY|nr:formate/nitrite transporter family protein [Halomarina oriensis]MWG33680.1 formate/nitrite transporter family protein [Halomarina oriensis]